MDNGDTDLAGRLKAAINDGQQQSAAAEATRLQKEEAAREAARQLEERTKEGQVHVGENVIKVMEGLRLIQEKLDNDHKFEAKLIRSPNDLSHTPDCIFKYISSDPHKAKKYAFIITNVVNELYINCHMLAFLVSEKGASLCDYSDSWYNYCDVSIPGAGGIRDGLIENINWDLNKSLTKFAETSAKIKIRSSLDKRSQLVLIDLVGQFSPQEILRLFNPKNILSAQEILRILSPENTTYHINRLQYKALKEVSPSEQMAYLKQDGFSKPFLLEVIKILEPDHALNVLKNNKTLRTLTRSEIIRTRDYEILELSILRKVSLDAQVDYLKQEGVRDFFKDNGGNEARQLVRQIDKQAKRAGVSAPVAAKPQLPVPPQQPGMLQRLASGPGARMLRRFRPRNLKELVVMPFVSETAAVYAAKWLQHGHERPAVTLAGILLTTAVHVGIDEGLYWLGQRGKSRPNFQLDPPRDANFKDVPAVPLAIAPVPLVQRAPAADPKAATELPLLTHQPVVPQLTAFGARRQPVSSPARNL